MCEGDGPGAPDDGHHTPCLQRVAVALVARE